TPALGENCVNICIEACKAAKKAGVKISCDLNYRGKLWTRDEARVAMTKICEYVDVCISNEEDAKDVFGIEAANTDVASGQLNKDGYKSVAKQLADKFHFEKVAITLRESISAFDNDWSAMLFDAASDEYCFSKLYHLHIIDRVGGGDSFGGGLIYSLLSGKNTQDAVEFAVAASALKHSIESDYNFVTVDEVEKLAGGNASGRVQR
ncbi:MAG: PfkB family carbohydrate kinase, partial [Ruthenibacterium sp.]